MQSADLSIVRPHEQTQEPPLLHKLEVGDGSLSSPGDNLVKGEVSSTPGTILRRLTSAKRICEPIGITAP